MRGSILAVLVGTALLADPTFGTNSSVAFIDADVVHGQGFTGQGVTVAVIDTGILYDHPGLAGSIAPGGISIIGGVEIPDGGADIYADGHGTYMSLIITDATGVAPDGDILPVRVLGPFGIDPWDVADAVDYVRQRRQQVDSSIRVINLSLGGGSYSCSCDDEDPVTQRLAEAIFNALTAGIVTFAATGNESECGGICAPACVSAAVRVAADYDGDYGTVVYYWPNGSIQCGDFSQPYWVTCFSDITESCEYFLAAPGYDITVGGFSGDGTSQATAHCSGVAALMFSKAPCGLSGWSAREIIWWNALTYEWAYPYCPLPPQPKHLNAYYAVNATPTMPCIPGDLNCDGAVDFGDIDPFVLALSDQAAYEAQFPDCRWLNADCNGDGLVDFGDIDPFVALLSG